MHPLSSYKENRLERRRIMQRKRLNTPTTSSKQPFTKQRRFHLGSTSSDAMHHEASMAGSIYSNALHECLASSNTEIHVSANLHSTVPITVHNCASGRKLSIYFRFNFPNSSSIVLHFFYHYFSENHSHDSHSHGGSTHAEFRQQHCPIISKPHI